MNQFLVIFLLEDFGVEYAGHWTGWVEGNEEAALEAAYAALMERAESTYKRDALTLARYMWKDEPKSSHTIVEIIG